MIGYALLPSQTGPISANSEGLKQFALCGMGGLGKTEIATKFAFQHKESFDAIFWIRAEGAAKMDSCFAEIAVRLGLEEKAESKNQVVSRDLVKDWLSDPWKMTSIEGRPTRTFATWLTVFDNADDVHALSEYWPNQGRGSVLITSRDPIAKAFFSTSPSGLDLAPFSAHDGRCMLRKLLRGTDQYHDHERQLAERITCSLGGLPLAIAQAAGIIRRQGLSLAEFIESYKDVLGHSGLHENKAPSERLERLERGLYPHTVATVWAFESLRPSTKNLLSMISFLDPDAIQEMLLINVPTESDIGYLDALPMEASMYWEALTELSQASLVKHHKDAGELTIHRLVQDTFRAKMNNDERVDAFIFAVNLVCAHWPRTMSPPTRKNAPVVTPRLWMIDRWPTCEILYPHVLRLKQLYETEMGDMWKGSRLQFASLLKDAAW